MRAVSLLKIGPRSILYIKKYCKTHSLRLWILEVITIRLYYEDHSALFILYNAVRST